MPFEERLENDVNFKKLIGDIFRTREASNIVFKEIGVETIFDTEAHSHIRYKHDITTEIIKYMPDLFCCWKKGYDDESFFIELKVARTGFKYENAQPLKFMRQKVSDLKKEEIINIELGSFENMLRLKSIGANVVIFIYCSFHEHKWLAIEPDESLNLKSYSTEEMKRTEGSGTPIANIFSRINNQTVFPLWVWLNNHFGIDEAMAKKFFTMNEYKINPDCSND